MGLVKGLLNVGKLALNKGLTITRKVSFKSSGGISNAALLKTANQDIFISETADFIRKLTKNHTNYQLKIKTGGINDFYTCFKESNMGSNPAFWAKNNRTGELFYVKYGSNIEHLESEILANKLYNLAGIKTPEMKLAKFEDGKKCIISKFCPGLKKIDKNIGQETFAVDAWLANWDTVVSGNTFSQSGKCIKLDCGGALKYRAQGELKPNFSNRVDELITMLDTKTNSIAANFYGDMSKDNLINSFKKVTSISDKAIFQIVEDKTLAQTLVNRKKYMQKVLNKLQKRISTNQNASEILKNTIEKIKDNEITHFPDLAAINDESINGKLNPLKRAIELIKRDSQVKLETIGQQSIIQNMLNQRAKMVNTCGNLPVDKLLANIKERYLGFNRNISEYIIKMRGDKEHLLSQSINLKELSNFDTFISQGYLPQNTTLYRGTSLQDFGLADMDKNTFIEKCFKKGRLFKIPIYPETSLSQTVGKVFSQGKILFKINAPKGTPAIYMEKLNAKLSVNCGNEEEVLLPRNLVYKFKKHIKTDDCDILEIDIVKRPAFWKKIHEFWKEI